MLYWAVWIGDGGLVNAITRIALIYAIVALFATLVNLATQAAVVFLYSGPFPIEISVLAGTASGLPVKYVLEKRHIFEFETESTRQDGKMFLIYSFLGVFTTAIFWGVEYAFQWIFSTDNMRYLGGAIGLALGYTIKYRLDKKFVFRKY